MEKSGKKLENLNSGIELLRNFMVIIVVWLMFLTATQVVQAGTTTPGGVSSTDDKLAFQTSISHLKKHAQDWGIQNADTEFRLDRISQDNLGQEHVRLDQIYNGISVFGQQLIVHMDRNGKLLSVTGNYRRGINIQTKPVLTGEKAKENALKHFSGTVTNIPEYELILYPMDKKVVLVYRVVIEDMSIPQSIVAFVDAETGALVDSYNNLQTLLPSGENQAHAQVDSLKASSLQESNSVAVAPAIGTGKSLYSGTINIGTALNQGKYFMLDMAKGSGSTVNGYTRTNDMNNKMFGSGTIFSDLDNIWGNFLNTDRATAGVDAHFGAEMTWDYYQTTYGRRGVYNDSKGTLSKVHYGKRYNNAFWSDSCKCMTYGDGDGILFSPLVSLDVAGHEMTHGVTSAVSGLIYTKQSGGLNEAMSDIFGTMVEFYASTHGATKTPNYWIGEDVFTPATPGDALRYMDNPTRDGYSIDTFLNYNDGIDVHYSSGIANNAFYLLAEGGTHRLGGAVTGIGKDKAELIFFRALDVYMAPSETFSQARAHTIQAATDLYGPSSQEVISVGQAWSAVGV
jgi:Zn-dependent metalloprotease